MDQPSSQGGRPSKHRSDPPWLLRLWANQRVPFGGDKLHWWSVHVQRFLAFVRHEQLQGPIDVLSAQFLDNLALRQPSPSDWQKDQVRQALEVFARGIQHWHFEHEPDGRLRPAFRLKAPLPAFDESVEKDSRASGDTGAAESNPNAQGDDFGDSWRTRFVATMRVRSYSYRTEQAYGEWIERFLRFHGDADPRALGEAEVREFLEYLVMARNVASSTQNQAFSALLFLYAMVLERPLGNLQDVLRARRPARLPVVLSWAEVIWN